MSAEQKARDMLERMGVENAQDFSAGELVELANLIAQFEMMRSALEEEKSDPFVRSADGLNLRHDAIMATQEGAGQVRVEFFWRGDPTITMHVDCDFALGQSLCIVGIDGKMECQIK